MCAMLLFWCGYSFVYSVKKAMKLDMMAGMSEMDRNISYNNNIIIIIFLKQDYMVQLANNKIQMACLTSWLLVGVTFGSSP